MKLLVGSMDVGGQLWVIRPRTLPAFADGGVLVERDGREDLRVVRHPSADTAIAQALADERCVAVFENGATFALRIARLVAELEALGVTPEWQWADETTSPSLDVDDETAAIAWFVRHSADLLFVDSAVALEKQKGPAPSWKARLRWYASVVDVPAYA